MYTHTTEKTEKTERQTLTDTHLEAKMDETLAILRELEQRTEESFAGTNPPATVGGPSGTEAILVAMYTQKDRRLIQRERYIREETTHVLVAA
jgi:hypothetical protein